MKKNKCGVHCGVRVFKKPKKMKTLKLNKLANIGKTIR